MSLLANKETNGSAHPDLRGARRSDPPGDLAPALAGRGDRQRARRAVRSAAAHRVEAPEGAAAGAAGHADPQGAVATLPARGRAAPRGRGVGGAISGSLGAAVRAARRV